MKTVRDQDDHYADAAHTTFRMVSKPDPNWDSRTRRYTRRGKLAWMIYRIFHNAMRRCRKG